MDSLLEQLKYFFVGRAPEIVARSEPVRCIICAESGHVSQYCPLQVCPLCNDIVGHTRVFCPKNAQCSRCGEREHTVSECQQKLKDPNRIGKCSLCQRQGHDDEQCELFWRTSGKIWSSPLPELSVIRRCYECGAVGHLGNDCALRDPSKVLGTSMWTQRGKFNDCFVPEFKKETLPQMAPPSRPRLPLKPPGQYAPKQRPFNGKPGSSRAQPIELDDDEDDQAFVNPRLVPKGVRGGEMHISSTIGFNPINRPHGNLYQSNYSDRYDQARSSDGRYRPEPPQYDGSRDEYRIRGNANRHAPPSRDNYRANGSYDRRRSRSPIRDNNASRRRPEVYRPMPSDANRAWKRGRT